MFNGNGFLFLYALSCTCVCSDLNINGGTVIANLYRPIELQIQETSVCNFTVDWRRPRSDTLCIAFNPVNKSQCFGDCCKRAQLHCQNSSFVLNSVAPSDEGNHEAKIVFQNNNIKKITITLKIMYPPNITNVSINSTHPTLIITCEASGGNVSYSWLKDGQDLRVMNQTLMVQNPTRSDCANYTCVAAGEGGSSVHHVNIDDGSALCIDSLDQRHEIKIVSAVICVLGLCIIVVCIEKLRTGICNNESWTPEERGNREPNTEEGHHLYDEPSNVQPSPSEVVQLASFYTDFIPVGLPAGHGEEVNTAAGYSTIGEVQQQVETLKALEQAKTMQALEQTESTHALKETGSTQVLDQTESGICNNESLTTEERGNREPNTEEGHHLYDEPSNVQPNPSEVVQLPYVYKDFIPVRSSAGHGEEANTVAGYSTIGEVRQQT